jgi:hypothetical protein
MLNYDYNKLTDIDSSKLYLLRLSDEIKNSSITAQLQRIDTTGNDISIVFSTSLTSNELDELTALVKNHSGEPYPPEDTPPVLEIDDEGRQTVRKATARKGWHYSAITAEVKTSTTDTYNKDYDGNDLGWVVVKLYDDQNSEITDPANYGNAVKTEVTITPGHDFEVIEGDVYHHSRPTEDVRLWTLAGITALGAAGTKVFVNGLNLRFMSPDDHIESDGRSSKFMNQYTDIPGIGILPSNQFQFILKHPAGYEHEVMILLETYKA